MDFVKIALLPSNAVNLLGPYDVILDCTDNAPTRYLLSDAAVFLGKPLVSGAAQKYEGQLCTYNLGTGGPCYRCLYPKPLAVKDTGTCEVNGILGVVTGIIGNLQALETLKIITGLHGRLILLGLASFPMALRRLQTIAVVILVPWNTSIPHSQAAGTATGLFNLWSGQTEEDGGH